MALLVNSSVGIVVKKVVEDTSMRGVVYGRSIVVEDTRSRDVDG